MNNDLISLNNYLFEQLERLNDDEELKDSKAFECEMKRAKEIANIADKIIKNANVVLSATRLKEEYGAAAVPSLALHGEKSNDD